MIERSVVSRLSRLFWVCMFGLSAVACQSSLRSVISPETEERELRGALYITIKELAEINLESIPAGTIAVAGLEGLTKLDASLSIRSSEGQIVLLKDGAMVRQFEAPDPTDVRGWVRRTVEFFEVATDKSAILQDVGRNAIDEALYTAMLTPLGDGAAYHPPTIMRNNKSGDGGIGTRVIAEANGIRILEVIADGPAKAAGLRVDDLITHVDGAVTADLEREEVIELLRGKRGSLVNLTIQRANSASPLDFSVPRERIVIPTVTYARKDNVAFITITGFNTRTANAVLAAITRAKKEIHSGSTEHSGPIGYVVDLRDNSGGLLDQGIAVADIFLERGRIFSAEGPARHSSQTYEAGWDTLGTRAPIVVLLNDGSAGASEIVAAALQDNSRAVIAGVGSFGLGAIKVVLSLPNRASMAVPWARMIAPSGYSFDKQGVLPVLCTAGLSEAADLDETIAAAVKAVDRFRRTMAERRTSVTSEARGGTGRQDCVGPGPGGDFEERIALRLLEDLNAYETLRQASIASQ